MVLEREHCIEVLKRYLDPDEVKAKLQRRGLIDFENENEMYERLYDLNLKFPTRPDLAEGIPLMEDGSAKDPLFEIIYDNYRYTYLCMRYDFRQFKKGHVIAVSHKLFNLICMEFTDVIMMGITNHVPKQRVEKWDYAMFLHYVTVIEGIQLPDTKSFRWKILGKRKKQNAFYDESFLDFRRRYFKLNRKIFGSLLPFNVTLQILPENKTKIDLLLSYSEQEKNGRTTEILIRVVNTKFRDSVTNVLLHGMLDMFFLGKDTPEYRDSLEEFQNFLGYGQKLTRKADGTWHGNLKPTKADLAAKNFGSETWFFVVNNELDMTEFDPWTVDSTVQWFHTEDYERQLRLQGKD